MRSTPLITVDCIESYVAGEPLPPLSHDGTTIETGCLVTPEGVSERIGVRLLSLAGTGGIAR